MRLLASLPLTEVSFEGHRLGGAGCAEAVRCFGHTTRFGFSSGEPAIRHFELAQLLVEPALSRLASLDLTLNGLDTGGAQAARFSASPVAAIRASPWIGRVKLLT